MRPSARHFRPLACLFVILALLVALLSLLFSNRLVKELAEEERRKMEVWPMATESIAAAAGDHLAVGSCFFCAEPFASCRVKQRLGGPVKGDCSSVGYPHLLAGGMVGISPVERAGSDIAKRDRQRWDPPADDLGMASHRSPALPTPSSRSPSILSRSKPPME